jgi:hypothetical protein
MIEIINPLVQPVYPISYKFGHGWHYVLDYSWVLDVLHDITIPGDVILEVGAGRSTFADGLEKAGYSVDTMDRSPDSDCDFYGDFLKFDFNGDMYNVILWVSSIEHQDSLDDIRACVDKSMSLLPVGGVFIATFGISPNTFYMDTIKGWCLSAQDSMRVFSTNTIKGVYNQIWDVYRSNRFKLRDNYVSRFGKWDIGSPDYLAAGVVKVKAKDKRDGKVNK